MYVSIGGIEQYLEFNDDAPDRPILLFLHGGPGGTSLPALMSWKPWEAHFTVVHWDQRGACRTFQKNGPEGCGALTIERMVRDGLEVTEFLIGHLNKPKVLLVGHSWGSVLGRLMLRRRPELFSGFVGTGLFVNWTNSQAYNYSRAMVEAERSKNTDALKALRELGSPPYRDRAQTVVLLEWSNRLAKGEGDSVLPRPPQKPINLTPEDISAIEQGMQFTRSQLFQELGKLDVSSLGVEFEVPIFVFQGTDDPLTPCELAERYFAEISAPHKEFVHFEGCHHFMVFNRPDDFLRKLLERVRPLLGTGGRNGTITTESQ
jgi:pimeloyl-ACP methyl ester carboxylesterase